MDACNIFSDDIEKINRSLIKSLRKGKRNSPLRSVKIEISDEFAEFLKTKFNINGRFKRVPNFFDTEIDFEETRYDDKFKYFIAVQNKVVDARIGCSRAFNYFNKKKQEKKINSGPHYIAIRFCRICFY